MIRKKMVIRPETEVIRKVKKLAKLGIKEAVLTGVNLSYWREAKVNFSGLVKAILVKTDIIRIRLESFDFVCFDDKFIPLFKNPRVCGHVHLPRKARWNRFIIVRGLSKVEGRELKKQGKDFSFSLCSRSKNIKKPMIVSS